MKRIHETLSGHPIAYDEPAPKIARLIERVEALVEDRKATDDDIIKLVYGKESPLLAETGGLVTREVFDNPVYHVLSDLLFRKRLAQDGVAAYEIAEKYVLTVADAAQHKGVSEDAIRKAARERRLPAWVKGGAYFFEPRMLETIALGGRGPVPKGTEPLEFRVGYVREEKLFLYIKSAEGLHKRPDTVADAGRGTTNAIKRWRRVGVLTGGHGKQRFFELEPGPKPAELTFHQFFVRGRFNIVRKVNSAKNAEKAWEAFRAS